MTVALPADPAERAAEPGSATARLPRRERPRLKESGLALLFLAPSLAVFAAFFYLPFIRILGWGTYRSVRGGQSYRSVGMSQYHDVLTGSVFRNGLVHSIQFVLLTVPAGLVLGTLLAVAAHRRLKGIKIFQTIFSSTLASSVAVSSVIFLFLLNPSSGLIRVDWTQKTGWSMLAAAIPSIWQNLGLAFVIVLAGLQAVPDEVLEAARLDGYGPMRRLFRITLPLISPVLLFLLVVLVIFGFQAFAQVEVVTGGGPAGSSETLVFKIFQTSQTDYGTAAVMSVGLFVVTFVVTAVQFLILDRRVHYGN